MFEMNLIKTLKASFEIVQSNNQRLLCHTMGGKTVIYNTETWGKVVELVKPKNPSFLHFTDNDDLLYIKNTVGTICVYETKEFQLIKTMKSRKSFKIEEGDFALLDQPFTILDILKINDQKQVCTLDIESGKYQVLTELEGSHIEFNQYVVGDDSYLCTLYYLKKINGDHYSRQKLVKIKNPLKNPSYSVENCLELQNWKLICFEPVHRVYIFVQEDYKITIMDADLKIILREEDLLDKGIKYKNEYFVHIATSNDGHYIVLTSNERVLMLRYDDFIPIHIEELEYACFAEFSRNGDYFLVGTWTKGYVFENNLNKP